MDKTKEQLELEYPQLKADIDLCYKYLFSICHGERLALCVPPQKTCYDMQISAALDELKSYRDTGLTPVRAAELVEAEKEGRLVILPCKLGERVYRHIFNCKGCEHYGDLYCQPGVNPQCKRKEVISIRFNYDDIYEIGKTVFLTRSEAEAALNQQDGD